MQSELFQNFIDSISTLTSEQRDILNNSLLSTQIEVTEVVETTDSEPVYSESIPNNDNATPDVEKSILAQFAENPRCPKCKSHSVGRWGIRNGRQRYHCKTCDSTFNAFSGTPLARLRHPEKWNKYLAGMTHSMVLRPAAAENAIDLKTAFRWRCIFW
ncbi:hypothetical protein [Endozoicomonas sp. SCSIO W0465]|uniref:IS1/IS1595 family N-terminal zinc-binding domain-containing protein n=1 Tax=Endozoicomonas sp. SCSIO W0465 TaxID=2918516 RepID=UPI00353252EB